MCLAEDRRCEPMAVFFLTTGGRKQVLKDITVLVRDWSLTTGRGGYKTGGGHVKFYPYKKGGHTKF